MLAVTLVILAFFVAVAVVLYAISGESGDSTRGGVIGRIAPYIPLQSMKIIIVAWQILTQVWRYMRSIEGVISKHRRLSNVCAVFSSAILFLILEMGRLMIKWLAVLSRVSNIDLWSQSWRLIRASNFVETGRTRGVNLR